MTELKDALGSVRGMSGHVMHHMDSCAAEGKKWLFEPEVLSTLHVVFLHGGELNSCFLLPLFPASL